MSERDRRRAELLNDSEATLRRVKSLLTDLEVDEGESPDGAADGSPASEAPTPQEGAEAAGGGLIDLVRTVFPVSDQIAEIVDSLQESKELLDRVAADRVRRTQAKLEEVSSATESAATSMLDGLDRALALVDEIEAVEEGKATEKEKHAEADESAASEDSKPAVRVADEDSSEAPEKSETEMLFAEDPAPVPAKKKRVKKDDAVLTASVFIGIGNKPFLRGSGAGLSWEKGQIMEFQEIGKWRWVAPAEMESLIEVQIFRNDEDADQSGKYELEPGQKLEVSPVF